MPWIWKRYNKVLCFNCKQWEFVITSGWDGQASGTQSMGVIYAEHLVLVNWMPMQMGRISVEFLVMRRVPDGTHWLSVGVKTGINQFFLRHSNRTGGRNKLHNQLFFQYSTSQLLKLVREMFFLKTKFLFLIFLNWICFKSPCLEQKVSVVLGYWSERRELKSQHCQAASVGSLSNVFNPVYSGRLPDHGWLCTLTSAY